MHYIGDELDVFALATGWKSYVRDRLSPYLKGSVIEIGAGKGSFTLALRDCTDGNWWCIEPDPKFAEQITRKNNEGAFGSDVCVVIGTETDLPRELRVDVILYLDVLEHIADDRAELARASSHLIPGGRIIVLSPAFQFLYSPFDKAIGHYRRYTRRILDLIRPPDFVTETAFYMDAPGCLLSLANRLFLRSHHPTPAQILFWDKMIVPLARKLDPLVARRFGRSVVVVWRKRNSITTGPVVQ